MSIGMKVNIVLYVIFALLILYFIVKDVKAKRYKYKVTLRSGDVVVVPSAESFSEAVRKARTLGLKEADIESISLKV